MAATAGPSTEGTGYSAGERLATRARKVDGQQYYIARIIQPTSGLIFRAFVPETFNLSIQNHWEPLFGELNNSSGSPASRIGAAIGAPINLKYFSRLIWLGTEPLSFNFTFLLDAYGDTEEDVQKPIIDLIRMSTPKRGNAGFLESPGPSMISDEKRIYMRIGNFFFLDSIVIDSLDITFYSIADATNGKYMSADIAVQMRTAYTPDQEDILNYFSKGSSSDNTLNNPLDSRITGAADAIKNTFNNVTGSLIQERSNNLSQLFPGGN